jgi:uncharacterized protein with FMN-binding domain
MMKKNTVFFENIPQYVSRRLMAAAAVFSMLALLSACVNLKDIAVQNPDLNTVANGTYRGNAKTGPVRVTLDVTVTDNTIVAINLIRHFNGLGKKAEAIIPKIIEAQSLEVDVVSGATGSSKAILLAVADALSKN